MNYSLIGSAAIATTLTTPWLVTVVTEGTFTSKAVQKVRRLRFCRLIQRRASIDLDRTATEALPRLSYHSEAGLAEYFGLFSLPKR